MTRTRVLVRHRQPLVSAGLASALARRPEFQVELDGAAGAQGGDPPPDVVVADYETALEVLAATAAPAARHARPHVLIVSDCSMERQIRGALEQGARGYLLLGCSEEDVAEAVSTIQCGGRYLASAVTQRMAESLEYEMPSAREIEVLGLLTRGHGNKAIAVRLNIAVGTVKSHVRSILQKVNASSRTEAAAIAQRRGLLSTPAAGARDGSSGGSAERTGQAVPEIFRAG